MSAQLAAWLVGGGMAAALAALAAVSIARGFDHGRTGKPPATPATGDRLSSKLKNQLLNASSSSEDDAAADKAKKSGAAIAALVGVLAAAGAGIAAVSNIFERDIDAAALTPVEISAGALQGTLLSPDEDAPIVLIVPGSGPTDRDGNNPLGGEPNSYRLLAEALAEEGIATVRVDKRGMFASAAAGNPNAVTVGAYAEDYRAWIDAIRERTGRKCVWLLGHSEGALMVSVAAEGRKDVCGLILIAGMGRKMGEVIRNQLQANPANAPVLDQAFAAIADLEAGRHPDTSGMHRALLPLFAPQVQDFLISVFAVDPVEAVRRAKVKTLVIQGTTDLQVTEEDARLLNKAPRTELELIRGMNHVLKKAPDERVANLATYANPDLPLHPKLADEIEEFIED